MRGVSVQSMHQRRSLQDQPNPRVAMTVDPPLVTLGSAKPPLQIEIILDRFILLLADEEAGKEAEHHRGHRVADRILGPLELIDQRLELLLDFVQAALDASGQAAELRLREPPFFSSKSRWSDSRTSVNASAILSPGG